jgi:hypothetical protein
VSKLLRHPFIVGDSPYQFSVNPNVDIEEYRKKFEESKANQGAFGSPVPVSNKISVEVGDIQLEPKFDNEGENNNNNSSVKKVSLKLPRRMRNTNE